jgi:hypothetical protein
MFGNRFSRLLVCVTILTLAAGVIAGPASANGRTNRLLAGLVVGAIIGAALSDGDRGRCETYSPPAPRYDPPRYYEAPSPRQAYDGGYRDGYADGTDNGRYQGYGTGYNNGYRDGRTDQYQSDAYRYSRPAPRYCPPTAYRPPPPVCW